MESPSRYAESMFWRKFLCKTITRGVNEILVKNKLNLKFLKPKNESFEMTTLWQTSNSMSVDAKIMS